MSRSKRPASAAINRLPLRDIVFTPKSQYAGRPFEKGMLPPIAADLRKVVELPPLKCPEIGHSIPGADVQPQNKWFSSQPPTNASVCLRPTETKQQLTSCRHPPLVPQTKQSYRARPSSAFPGDQCVVNRTVHHPNADPRGGAILQYSQPKRTSLQYPIPNYQSPLNSPWHQRQALPQQQPDKNKKCRRSNSVPSSRPLDTDEESQMWCKLAIIEHQLDQIEEGLKARYRPRKSTHNYHSPVVALSDTSVPDPWPINLFLVRTGKGRPGNDGTSDTSSVYEDPGVDEFRQMKVTNVGYYIFGWRIRNIAKRVRETESSNAPLYSSPFSTGPNGYHMCLEIYLSGNGQDTHVSLYLVMLDSGNDALKWPFIKPVIFELVNQQDPTKSVSTSFISQIWSPLDPNKKRRDGLPRFIRRSLLFHDSFTRNDQIIIKCKIDLDYCRDLFEIKA